jgi:hypothetical protein
VLQPARVLQRLSRIEALVNNARGCWRCSRCCPSCGMPSLRFFPRPAGLGDRALAHRQRPKRPFLQRSAQILREPGTPTHSATQAAVTPSTPGVFAPWLPATQLNATISVAGSHARLTGHRTGGPDRPPPNGEAWPASPLPATTTPRPGPAHCQWTAPLAALEPSSLLETAAALPQAPGPPRPAVLRRVRRAPGRSADGALSPAPPRWPRGRRAGQGRFKCSPCDSLTGGGARLCPRSCRHCSAWRARMVARCGGAGADLAQMVVRSPCSCSAAGRMAPDSGPFGNGSPGPAGGNLGLADAAIWWER